MMKNFSSLLGMFWDTKNDENFLINFLSFIFRKNLARYLFFSTNKQTWWFFN